MRMEFSRLAGAFISQRPWPVDGRPIEELTIEAKNALAGFYDGDEYSFWPKKEYAANPPEQVLIIDFRGTIVVEYDLGDLLGGSRRSLVAGKDA